VTPNDLTLRPLTGRDELDLFTRLPYTLNGELADDLAAGRRRPEWLWVALRGDRLLARAAWWSRPGGEVPLILDVLDLDDAAADPDRVDVGVRLLRAATAAVLPEGAPAAEYSRFVPPDWREDAPTRRAVQDRMAVVERTGGRLLVERLRLEWRPGTPLPEPTRRLAFRPFHGTEEVLALMTSALTGTLDAHSRADLTGMTAREAAAKHYGEELARYTTPRAWWQVATLPDGEPVGFVIPAHNGYNPVIAYVAVLPAHRGHAYVDALLTEGTRTLATHAAAPRVRAATDLANTPMAAAFRRAGYVDFEREITMVWG
jgi:RimJ/RimL family protein N-acetyltransferase